MSDRTETNFDTPYQLFWCESKTKLIGVQKLGDEALTVTKDEC